jgi:hypothetical protein
MNDVEKLTMEREGDLAYSIRNFMTGRNVCV